MNRVTIFHFKEKNQNRLAFVSILHISAENSELKGLKNSKIAMDSMLDGIPIIVDVKDENLTNFLSVLNELKVEYKVENCS